MKCPICKTEAKVDYREKVTKPDGEYIRMHYVCRDRQCSRYDKEIGTEDIKDE